MYFNATLLFKSPLTLTSVFLLLAAASVWTLQLFISLPKNTSILVASVDNGLSKQPQGLRKNQQLTSMTHQYCSAGTSGTENVHPPNAEDLELKKVTVLARHGDRSAIHSLPNSLEGFWSCHISNEMEEVMEDAKSHFQVREITTNEVLKRSFYPDTINSNNDMDYCAPGQLTDRGMKQHQSLGQHLKQVYKEFLEDHALSPDSIFVRSTDYPRTIQSAISFLTAFLPNWRSFEQQVDLWTYEDMNSELMHGQGIKHESSKTGNNQVAGGACTKAITLATQQKASFDARFSDSNSSLISGLEQNFGPEVNKIKVTDLTDPIHARICHDMPLPCSSKGCVSDTEALEMIKLSSELYCDRYAGKEGGAEATGLAMQPFLKTLLQEILEVVQGSNPHIFSLYVGHDTVIAPVLAVLGGYDCKWPPYASYISIEVWTPLDGENGLDSNAFFRIFFNGKPVTFLLESCTKYVLDIQERNDEKYQYGLCPVSSLQNTIESIISPYGSLKEACSYPVV